MEKIADEGATICTVFVSMDQQQTKKDLAVRMLLIFLPKLRLVIFRRKRLMTQHNNSSCVVIKVQCK